MLFGTRGFVSGAGIMIKDWAAAFYVAWSLIWGGDSDSVRVVHKCSAVGLSNLVRMMAADSNRSRPAD